MPTAYRSTVLEQPVDEIWNLIRDFDNYPKYIEGVTSGHIEDGRPGDAVGAIRTFVYGEVTIRQRLVALSDTEHSFTYEGMDPFDFPSDDDDRPDAVTYQGTLRITEIADGTNRTFAKWFVSYEGSASPAWHPLLSDLITRWLESLRRTLDGTR